MAKNVEEAVIEDYLEGEKDDDDMEDSIDDQTEKGLEAQDEHGPYPEAEEKKDVLRHIQDTVLKGTHKFKTANLVWEELGRPNFSVRFWINLANASKQLFDMNLVSEYCLAKAAVTSETSLSRDGYINDLTVTSRKVKERKESGELKKFLEEKSKRT